MVKIKRNDEVIILAGKDKGRRGIVKQRIGLTHLLVDGVNVVRKAVKPNPVGGVAGGIVEKSMPIHVSNVALFNAGADKASKVGFKMIDGKKIRIFKVNNEAVEG